MATRAIRHDKLNFESIRTADEAIRWTNYAPNDTFQLALQEAVAHNITHNGVSAQTHAQKVNLLRNQNYAVKNYYTIMSNVYNELIPYLIQQKIDAGLESFFRAKLTEMRDVADSLKITNNGYSYFNASNDPAYDKLRQEVLAKVYGVAKDLNTSFFTSLNGTGITVIHANVSPNLITHETTDEEIESMATTPSYKLWRHNSYYLLNGGFGRQAIHQYPKINADVMEGFMEYLTDSNPALCLKIASYHQFFQDNPMVSSIGHSWTSKNRSDDCWFKVHASLVEKKNTVAFEPPRFFFGQSTPTLTDMCETMDNVKTVIEDYLKSADAQVKDSKAILEDKKNKTEVSYEKALIATIQGLLDDKATESVGTACISHIAGIARMAIDTSSFPNGHISLTYHDYVRNCDQTAYIYPQHLKNVCSLTEFNISDEVQGVLFQAYQDTLKSHRDNHANRCAQLARQIAQATSRHDAEVAVIVEAFTAYQTQV